MAIIDELIAVLGFDLRGEAEAKRFQTIMNGAERSAHALAAAIGRAAAVAGAAAATGFTLLGKGVLETGSAFEKLNLQLEMLEGSSQAAKERMDWLRKFAINTPLDLKGATAAYVKMKNFGMDPLNGSMQAIVDSNAMMAGSQEQLEGIILALGQAWTKEKFQAEEANQLLERGVPAWELLSKAMGKTTAEVQALSEKGKIGRKEIALLIEAMGKRAKGASERFSKTFQGLTDKIIEKWTDFKKQIADSGFFQNTKNAFEGLLTSIERWEQDGTIKNAAEFVSGTFTKMSEIVTAVVDRIITHMAFLNKHWDQAKPYVTAFGIALAGLIAYAFPVIAALGVLAVIIEEVLTYFQGGESITGKLVEAFKNLYQVVAHQLNKTFGDLLKALIAMDWEQTGREVAKLLIAGLKALGSMVMNLWSDINEDVAANGGWLDLGKRIAQGILDGFKAVKNYIVGFWSEIWKEVYEQMPDWMKWTMDKIGMSPGASPAAADGGSASGGSSGSSEGRNRSLGHASTRGRGERGGKLFNSIAPRLMKRLIEEKGLTPEQAAGVVGNLGHESAGFTAYEEGAPNRYGTRGVGWAQWTNTPGSPRRTMFENWAKKHGLNPRDPATSERYLFEGDPEFAGAIAAVKKTGTSSEAMKTFEAKFERAGVKHYASRQQYANRALKLHSSTKAQAEHPTGPSDENNPILNFQAHQQKVSAARNAPTAANNNTQNVNVNAPITMSVQQATDAPKAAANAVSSAVQQVQPARMQAGPAR